MKSLGKWFRRWGPSLIWMALIFGASGTPGDDLPSFGMWDLYAKKGGHMLGYALLGAAYLHGLTNSRRVTLRFWFLAVMMAGLYAASDEFHQSFTPGRNPSPMDVLIDTGGAILGVSAWTWVQAHWMGLQQSA
jgi:hypothetical protein